MHPLPVAPEYELGKNVLFPLHILPCVRIWNASGFQDIIHLLANRPRSVYGLYLASLGHFEIQMYARRVIVGRAVIRLLLKEIP